MDREAELHRLLAEYRKMEKEMARLEDTKNRLPGREKIQQLVSSGEIPLDAFRAHSRKSTDPSCS